MNLSGSFIKKVKRYDHQRQKVKKLSPFESYIAVLKGYCVLSILLLPKAFYDGGWLISPSFIVFNGVLSCIACIMLIDTGLAYKIYSYPLIVERVLGKKARLFLEIAIALTQLGFVISYVTFLVSSCKTTIDTLSGKETNPVIYGVIICVVFTLLSWVRNLAMFSYTFMIGVFMILVTTVYVLTEATK